ncbi:MAG: hypothetical protein A4E25_02295 [Methanobacterium sp. PtaB.Bin024]|nr:MAG: hypothetical protein A4E25_02295 [Methanobacterium sp. PtaB.Bin024]
MSNNMENSQKLKEKLMETYQDKSLEDLENGEEIETKWVMLPFHHPRKVKT